MDNAFEILIKPISEVWESLKSQAKGQASICEFTRFVHDHPAYRNALISRFTQEELFAIDGMPEHLLLSNKLSIESYDLLNSNKEVLLYPFLVNSWAVTETAFDDLIIRLLINDVNASEKLLAVGIENLKNFIVGSDLWVNYMFKRIENKASSSANNRDFEYHKKCLSYFEINLEYPFERVTVLKIINQIRNCILHNQGIVRQQDVLKCPSLSAYIGKRIPADEPIFLDCLTWISDYTLAWISAVLYSPYCNGVMLKDAKSPFAINS